MGLTVMSGQLTTGMRLTQLPVISAPWSTELGGAGSISAGLKLDSQAVRRRPELMLAVEPLRSFLAVLNGDRVIEAGPIWSHDYDDGDKTLTLRAGGLRSIFDHRLVMKVLAPGEDPAETALAYNGALADIARALVQDLVAHTGGALPIVFGEEFGGTHEATYPGHELSVAGAVLADLSGRIGGPEIAFEPRLTQDRKGLEWVMRTGTPIDPLLHQAGSTAASGDADWIWDRRAPGSGITSLSVKRDASKVAYRRWATGDGAEQAMRIASLQDSELIEHGYPLLEAKASHSSVSDPATLDEHVLTELLGSVRPTTTWSMDVRANLRPTLGVYRPGDWARVWVPADHDYLRHYISGEGFYRTRLVKIAGNLTQRVQLDMAPTIELR